MTRFKEVNKPLHDTTTTIPTRATKGSAGYDFHLKETVKLHPGQTQLTFTDVKCELNLDEVLYAHIRSSVGTKKHVALANKTGVIDSDFFENPDNDGNIGLSLHNFGSQTVTFQVGERVAQGVIHRIVIDDDVETSRTGGFGSSNA